MEENDKKNKLDALLRRREMLNALYQRGQPKLLKRAIPDAKPEFYVSKQTSCEDASLNSSDIIEDSDSEPPVKQQKKSVTVLDSSTSSNDNINTSMISLSLGHPFFGNTVSHVSSPVKINTNKKITIISDEIVKRPVRTYQALYENSLDAEESENNCLSKGISKTGNCYVPVPSIIENCGTYLSVTPMTSIAMPEKVPETVNTNLHDETPASDHTYTVDVASSNYKICDYLTNPIPQTSTTEPGTAKKSDETYLNNDTPCMHDVNAAETDQLLYKSCDTYLNGDKTFSMDTVYVKPGCSSSGDVNNADLNKPLVNKSSRRSAQTLKKIIDYLSDEEIGDYSAGSSEDWAQENESESSEEETNTPAKKQKKTKKAQLQENDLMKKKKIVKINKRKYNKKCREEGKIYENQQGKTKQEKQMKSNPCLPEKCKRGCFNITEEKRTELFTFFWKLDLQRRKDWLVRSSHVVQCQRKRTDSPISRRNITYEYYINNGADHQKVCQKFLLKTLDVSQKFLLYTVSNSKHEMATNDQRKRHTTNKFSDVAKAEVRKFIEKLPAVPSHYNRKRSNRVYLPQELKNISNLYRLYMKECHSFNYESVSESMFRSIFNSEYNISFHTPKKDKCIICVKAEHNDDLSENDKKNLENHLKEKQATYKRFKLHQNLPNIRNKTVVSSFDLQKILNTPYGDSVVLYYSRKYPVFNFTIYESVTQNVYCYLWGECDGKRGANEIATCLYSYFKTLDERGVKHLLLYCDSCGGQNKNKTVLSVLNYFLMKSESLEVIQINYLLPGHTYMPVDSVHATIERQVKKLIVWSPTQWPSYIQVARKNLHPYEVTKMEHSDFLKWDEICEESFTPETCKNIKIRNIRTATLKKKNLNQISLKYGMEDDTPTDVVTLFKKGSTKGKGKGKGRGKGKRVIAEESENSHEKVMTMSPSLLYKSQLPISDAKYKDLKRLCENGTIPKMYHRDYLDLPHGNVVDNLTLTDAEDEDDNEEN